MSGPAPQFCPDCGGTCKLRVDIDSGSSANLGDRYLALSPMACRVVCEQCGLQRRGTISDLDVNLDTGRLEFGTLTLDE